MSKINKLNKLEAKLNKIAQQQQQVGPPTQRQQQDTNTLNRLRQALVQVYRNANSLASMPGSEELQGKCGDIALALEQLISEQFKSP